MHVLYIFHTHILEDILQEVEVEDIPEHLKERFAEEKYIHPIVHIHYSIRTYMYVGVCWK